MAEFTRVCGSAEVLEGGLKEVQLGAQELCLARVEGKLYAVDNRCPHLKARLSNGSLAGTVLTCPWHGSRFDLRDGLVVEWTPALPGVVRPIARLIRRPKGLRTYEVREEGEDVAVRFG
ncbi:MAG: Rieske (2Fe-2S) protein [Dehalococcoidia bacterium]